RYLDFCINLFKSCGQTDFAVSAEVERQFRDLFAALQDHHALLADGFSGRRRREMLDALGGAGDRYRAALYNDGFSGEKAGLPAATLIEFFKLALDYVDQTISTNRRQDGLYHSYNLMQMDDDGGISIRHLYEMLEGQVAVLSSGKLSAAESLDVLKALRSSSLYREDQHSYILYPNRTLKPFMQKNCIPDIDDDDPRIVSRDGNGVLHFNPEFRNAARLEETLKKAGYPEQTQKKWLDLYEEVFDHESFTGRSGTFFKYEGLGSIYWHMVSKLLLAVQETCIQARGSEFESPLMERYYDIRRGIGAHKSVQEQGAFPTDPYSHTPSMMGAQQPGLTGQVKEDFISRMMELGVRVKNGCLGFDPFLSTENDVRFTICTVPVNIHKDGTNRILVERSDGESVPIDGLTLDAQQSAEIFNRSGTIQALRVTVQS
ncbi:MAG TPA: hypothetical protein VJ904_13250, partial [Tichowtungia sp.]|nr:hypothetical protein [Tichowtungia sp.]